MTNPACGVTTYEQAQAVGAGAVAAHHQSRLQESVHWQSSIGFQKQINPVTGFEADLTHFNRYRDTRTIDPNLFFNPATGYNLNPAAVNGWRTVPTGPTRRSPISSATDTAIRRNCRWH